MTTNESTINKFYTAFANANTNEMCQCYHQDIEFRDPIFGSLKGNQVCSMWKMLIESSKGNIKIDFFDIKVDNYSGSAHWKATYIFSKTNRVILNSVHAQFQFKDGLIIKHTDDFDIWKWTKQAFGWKGLLLGWTGFMQQKIQQQAQISLKNYAKKTAN